MKPRIKPWNVQFLAGMIQTIQPDHLVHIGKIVACRTSFTSKLRAGGHWKSNTFEDNVANFNRSVNVASFFVLTEHPVASDRSITLERNNTAEEHNRTFALSEVIGMWPE